MSEEFVLNEREKLWTGIRCTIINEICDQSDSLKSPSQIPLYYGEVEAMLDMLTDDKQLFARLTASIEEWQRLVAIRRLEKGKGKGKGNEPDF